MSLRNNYCCPTSPASQTCEKVMFCINKNLTRLADGQSNDLVNFCQATVVCVEAFLRALPGYTATGDIFLALSDDSFEWLAGGGGGGTGTVTDFIFTDGDGFVGTVTTSTTTPTLSLTTNVGHQQIMHSSNGAIIGYSQFYYVHDVDPISNAGQVNLINAGGLGPEVGFRYKGSDIGNVRNEVENDTNAVGAGASYLVRNNTNKIAMLTLGASSNFFAPNATFLYTDGDFLKLATNSSTSPITFCVGALGAPTANEKMRVTTTGLGILKTVPTEALDVTGNIRFSGALMPNNLAGTSGYILTSTGATSPVWTNPTSIITATPTLQQVITAGATLTGDNTIVNGANTLTFTNNTLAGDYGVRITSNSTLAAAASQILFNVELSGANANTSEPTVAGYFSNEHTGSGTNFALQAVASNNSSSNIAGYFGAVGGTSNVAIYVPNTFGNIILGTSSAVASAGILHIQTPTTTGTTTSSGIVEAMNTLSTGTGHYISSSTLSSGKILDVAITGIAALTNQTALNIALSGANTSASQTTYGLRVSNTHTGTTPINYAATFKGLLGLEGTTSGTVTITPVAVAGTWTWTLPANGGTVSYVLITNGSGGSSWADVNTIVTPFTLTSGSGTTAVGTAVDLGGILTTSADIRLNSGTAVIFTTSVYNREGLLGAEEATSRAWIGDNRTDAFGTYVRADDAISGSTKIILNAPLGNIFMLDQNTAAASIGYVWALQDISTGRGQWVPATASGITSLAVIGSTPNANGATISGVTLNLEPANASFGGVVTTVGQTFAGQKTFTGGIISSSNVSITYTNTTGGNSTSTLVMSNNSLTSGTQQYISSNSITSGNFIDLASTSTALASGNEILNIAMSGANASNAITATGVRISVTNTNATSGTNVGLDITASGATTDNIAITATGAIRQTSANTTGATTTSSKTLIVNSLTTGTALYIESSSLTSGKAIDIAITGTAALTNQKGINISLSGANGTGAQTTYGIDVSNTHAGTTSVNRGIRVTATGGTTGNVALEVVAGTGSSSNLAILATGRCGFAGTTAPQFDVDVGTGSLAAASLYAGPAAGGTNGNFMTANTSLMTSNVNSMYQILGSSAINGRIFIGGNGATAISTGAPYGTVLIGAATVPEASSGNHPLISSLVVIPPTITGAAATVTDGATIYVDAPTAGTVSGANYSLLIRTGNVQFTNGNLTLGTAGNKLTITEGTDGRVGQTTLVSGTKAITITGVTTSSRAFVTLVTPTSVTLTVQYQAVCTANTLTIQANVAAGTINTADGSVLNYFVLN